MRRTQPSQQAPIWVRLAGCAVLGSLGVSSCAVDRSERAQLGEASAAVEVWAAGWYEVASSGSAPDAEMLSVVETVGQPIEVWGARASTNKLVSWQSPSASWANETLAIAAGVTLANGVSLARRTPTGGTYDTMAVRGSDGVFYERWRAAPGGPWNTWTTTGGTGFGAPAVTAISSGATDIVHIWVRASDNSLWLRRWNAGWTWYSLGKPPSVNLTGSVAAAPRGTTGVDVATTGSDGNVWVFTWNEGSLSGTWGSWGQPSGVAVASSPGVTVNSSKTEVFITGADGRIYTRSKLVFFSAWSDSPSRSGTLLTAPPALGAPAAGTRFDGVSVRTDLVYLATNGRTYARAGIDPAAPAVRPQHNLSGLVGAPGGPTTGAHHPRRERDAWRGSVVGHR